METQKTYRSQNNMEQFKSTSHYSWFQIILHSYSNKKHGTSIKADIRINGKELRTQIKAHAPTTTGL